MDRFRNVLELLEQEWQPRPVPEETASESRRPAHQALPEPRQWQPRVERDFTTRPEVPTPARPRTSSLHQVLSSHQALRQAIVVNEILGLPKALKDPDHR